jgi:hypothetical protein
VRNPPRCDYCGAATERVGGDVIYPHRPDLAAKVIYRCVPCGAWVGCHHGTDVPLGRLADSELRLAKQAAHAAFDPLWEAKRRREDISKSKARNAGYEWLAEQLGIKRRDCHLGMMDVAQCRRVVEICTRRGR